MGTDQSMIRYDIFVIVREYLQNGKMLAEFADVTADDDIPLLDAALVVIDGGS